MQTRHWRRTALHVLAQRGFLEAFRSLIRIGADAHRLDIREWGIVAYAVFSGSVDMVQELLGEFQSKTVWTQTFSIDLPWKLRASKCSAPHLAATRDHDMFMLLASSGYYENIHKSSGSGLTPLHFAVGYSNEDIAEWLISHVANVNALTVVGEAPLHFAMRLENLHGIRALIEAGVEFVRNTLGQSPEDLTPVHICTDLHELLDELNAPASVLQKFQTKEVAQKLFSAISQGNLDTCQRTIRTDGSWKSVHSSECDICTSLVLALFTENWDIVELLLENDASMDCSQCGRHVPYDMPEMSTIHKPGFNPRLPMFLDLCLTHQTY